MEKVIEYISSNQKDKLSDYIQHLVVHCPEALIHLLYRFDVDEDELKSALKNKPASDTAFIIADMIWKRSDEKQSSKENCQKIDMDNIEDDLRW